MKPRLSSGYKVQFSAQSHARVKSYTFLKFKTDDIIK